MKVSQKIKASFSHLNNKFFEKTLSEDAYRAHIFNILSFVKDDELESVFRALSGKPKFRRCFNGYAENIEGFNVKAIFRSSDAKVGLNAVKGMLLSEISKIDSFIEFRTTIERDIIFGNLLDAERKLEEVKRKYGESIWYIRNKILVLSQQGRNSDVEDFCNTCRQRSSDMFIGIILENLQMVIHTENSEIRLDNLISKNLNEFRGGNEVRAASILSLIFVPVPFKGLPDYLDSFDFIQTFPLIDQYLFFEAIAKYSHIDTAIQSEDDRKLVNDIRGFLRSKFKNVISDDGSAGDEFIPELSEVGQDILRSYECGNYAEVVEIFNKKKNQIKNPLAYVNIVAKSRAQISLVSKEILAGHTDGSSFLFQIIEHLTALYNINSGKKQAKEKLISIAIKLHGFVDGPYSQLCLYAALPLYYKVEDQLMIAKLSMISNREFTPLVSNMGSRKIFSFGTRYGNKRTDASGYQALRGEICSVIRGDGDIDELSEKLARLEETNILPKDFLELKSECLLHKARYNDLIEFSVKSLCKNGENYVFLPMLAIINEIEKHQYSTIEAVVFSYYFNKYFSESKNFVLNESFEEFVLKNHEDRPSEILKKQIDLDDIDLIFYRDVCVPEVLDFLTVFSTGIELRAERVKILNMLLERRVIDPDFRMREVEQIVEQVVVEAGTQEFNTAKIYVDENSIVKRNSQEIRELLNSYKSASDQDDRIIVLNDAGSDPKGVYTSGSKNSIVIKIYSLIRKDFLYNEMYGLAKNLSTEIRHGFFSNLIRARLLEKRIITELDEKGNYRSNDYWHDQYPFLRKSAWLDIDSVLSEFSKNFNALIREAEEWMKISTSNAEVENLFLFNLTVQDFEIIKNHVDEVSDSDRISAFVIGILITQLDFLLKIMRDRIDGSFRARVDALFELLLDGINREKRNAPMIDFVKAINLSRSEIKEDITTVVGWFNRNKATEITVRSIHQVIEIAINSFEKIKGGGLAISRNISSDLRQVLISGRPLKSLVIALTNLLDNCYRHSGLYNDTIVEILGAKEGDLTFIRIRNSISSEKSIKISNDTIDEIYEKMRSPESIELMRTEGGSGIPKAYNEILTLSQKSDLQLGIEDGYFFAKVIYGS